MLNYLDDFFRVQFKVQFDLHSSIFSFLHISCLFNGLLQKSWVVGKYNWPGLIRNTWVTRREILQQYTDTVNPSDFDD